MPSGTGSKTRRPTPPAEAGARAGDGPTPAKAAAPGKNDASRAKAGAPPTDATAPRKSRTSSRSATSRRLARPKRSVGGSSPVLGTRRQRRLAVALAVVNVLVGGAAGYLWYDEQKLSAREDAAQRCLARSTAAAQAIFSYDYRTFDASVANARSFLVGPFADEYEETTRGLKPAAEQQQAVVRAEVSAAGIADPRANPVEVLLYVNQYRRNITIAGEKVDQNRVVLTMVPGEDCRVARATAI